MLHLSDRGDASSDALLEEGPASTWLGWLVVGALTGIFLLDRQLGSAPMEHLYYLPIILASTRLGGIPGLLAALAAVLLYHLATPHLLTLRYMERDVVQIGLFLAVSLTSTKLAGDARALRHFATTDDLTGLRNLRSFTARLSKLVRQAPPGSSLALLVLDVDRLKSLNDAHGHLTGAEAVRTVGRTIAERAPPEAIACRYGGDEFVVALPGCGPQRALSIAEGLRAAVSDCAPVLSSVAFPAGTLTISVGVAWHTFEGQTPAEDERRVTSIGESLFRAADAALYAAKGAGRNRAVLAAPPTRPG